MPYFRLLAAFIAICVVASVAFYTLMLAIPFGAAWAFVIACGILAERGPSRPALVTPDQVARGTRLLPWLRRVPHRRDWAWPSYLASQWWYDWRTGLWSWYDAVRNGVQRNRGFMEDAHPALRQLLALIPGAGWTGTAIGMLLGGATVTVVCFLALVVIAAGWAAVLGTLRGCDGAARRVRKAAVTCPHEQCYYQQRVPDYRCPGCDAVHQDIRPGILGAMWRRCGCGAQLPTTVLRAAHRLHAQCKRCKRPLRAGSAAVTSISLPVFGPVSAGKTRLVYAGLAALDEELTAAGGELGFADDASRRAFEQGTRVIADGGDTAKTPAGRLPTAITAQVRHGRRSALLDLFDAAGEFFADREDNAELEFLDHAGGSVFVVDPFSVPWVQDQLGGPADPRVLAAQPAVGAPEEIYRLTAERLRDYRVDLHRRALAVVVVKADLVPDQPWAEQLLSGSVRDWLRTAGQDNLVLAADRDFAATRYFVTSSVGTLPGNPPGNPLSPAEPFRWLLQRGGFRLPSPRCVPQESA